MVCGNWSHPTCAGVPPCLNSNSWFANYVNSSPKHIWYILTDIPSCPWGGRKMQYEEEGETLADKSACAGIRADLKMCLLNSDCVKRDKKTPRQCLNVTDGSVPTECQALRNTFFECKRSMLDNRARFRGRKGY